MRKGEGRDIEREREREGRDGGEAEGKRNELVAHPSLVTRLHSRAMAPDVYDLGGGTFDVEKKRSGHLS